MGRENCVFKDLEVGTKMDTEGDSGVVGTQGIMVWRGGVRIDSRGQREPRKVVQQ